MKKQLSADALYRMRPIFFKLLSEMASDQKVMKALNDKPARKAKR